MSARLLAARLLARPTLTLPPMRPLRTAAALAVTVVVVTASAPAAGAQTTVFTFDAVPTATAPGAFATVGGYSFTNFSTLETASPFGTGSNGVGARFAYVPLGLGYGSVRRESADFFFQSALLSFRAFDGNTSAPLFVTVNGYRGFDPGADPVFTRVIQLTNAATLFEFNTFGLSEVEFLTDGFEAGGRRAVLAVDNLTLTAVPEPASVVLVGAGAAVLAAGGWRRRRARTA